MGYKTIGTNGSKYIKNTPRDPIDDSRVYDHYDYAFDEFETYDGDDLESEEACLRETEEGVAPQRFNRDSKAIRFNPRWEKLKCGKTLQEFSGVWFSQAPFDLEPDQNTMDWKFTQTDPATCCKSRSTQTHQVAQLTVASMAPDDLATPPHVRIHQTVKHSFNIPFSTWKSCAQETQLKSFLFYAAYVLESLVARPVEQGCTKLRDLVNEDRTSGRLTGGSMTLHHTDQFLEGRPLHFIAFKGGSSTSFLCCYGPGPSSSSSSSTHEYVRLGCIRIFDILSKPSLQFTLLVQGVPLCASWSKTGGRSNWGVIVAGTQDGSLALWDLSSKLVGTFYGTRALQPTYSTNFRIEENHSAPIQRVSLNGNFSNEVSPGRISSKNSLLGGALAGNFLKVLSLDKLGFVHLWIVKEVQMKDAGDDELGLHPEGHLYLVRTGSTNVIPRPIRSLEIAVPEACTFADIPGRVQEILVALSDGTLVKTSLVGSRPSAPKIYTRPGLKWSKPVPSPVLCLCFSPFVEDCFLVVYADSTVAIFIMEKSYPWGIWTLPSTESGDGHIISAQWSPSDSTVFFVAVSSRTVHVFDVSRGHANPTFSETLDCSDDIACFEVTEHEAVGNRSTATEHLFVTASIIGNIQVHVLKQTSKEYSAESLKHVLLAPLLMI